MVELSNQFGKPYFTKGGQGKFFADPKPVDEHRYPRGYTPERMSAVHGALAMAPQDRPSVGPSGTFMGNTKFVSTAGRHAAHFRETVARSTMPLGGIKKQLGAVHASSGYMAERRFTSGLTSVTSNNRTGALSRSLVNIYHGSPGLTKVPPAQQGGQIPSRREVMGVVAIHELGHVQHAMVNPTRYAHFPSGVKEHYADRFAETHFRSDPRDVRRGTNVNPADISYPATSQPLAGKFAHYRNWDVHQVDALSRQFQMHRKEPPSPQGQLF